MTTEPPPAAEPQPSPLHDAQPVLPPPAAPEPLTLSQRPAPPASRRSGPPWRLIGCLALLLVGLGAGGLYYYGQRQAALAAAAAAENRRLAETAAVEAGRAALAAQDWAAAEAEFSTALAVEPLNERQHVVEATLGRAIARYQLARYPEALSDFDAVLALDPARTEVYRYQTEIYWAQGDFDAALAAGEQALAHDDAYGLPYALRADAAYRDHDEAAALEFAQAALDRDDSLALAYRLRGALRAWQFDLGAAEADLSRALNLDPDDVEALALRVYVAVEREADLAAEADVNRLLELDAAAPASLWAQSLWAAIQFDQIRAHDLINQAITADDERAEFYVTRAATYLLTADDPKALEDYEQALALRPDYAAALAGVAFWHVDRYEYDTLEADALRLIALAPQSPYGYYLLESWHDHQHADAARLAVIEQFQADFPHLSYGHILRGYYHLDLREYDAAREAFAAALAMYPRDVWAHIGLAGIAWDQNDLAQAQVHVTDALALDPDRRSTLSYQAVLHITDGDLEAAEEVLETLFDLDPGYPDGLVARAILSTARGDQSQALADLGRVITDYPGFYYAYSVRANAYLVQGDVDRARRDGQRLLELDTQEPDGFSVLAYVADAEQAWDVVIQRANRALDLDPELADMYWLRGRAQWNQNNLDDAQSDLERAVELAPERFDARFDLGNLLYLQGEIEAAIEHLQTALELTDDLDQLDTVESQLAFLNRIPPLVDGFRTVIDRQGDYTITYPGTWLQLATSPEIPDIRLSLRPLDEAVAVMYVFVFADPNPDLTLEELADFMEASILANNPNFETLSLEPFQIGELDGLVRQYELTVQGVTVNGRQYYVVDGDRWAVINFESQTRAFADLAPDADLIVRSFAFRE